MQGQICIWIIWNKLINYKIPIQCLNYTVRVKDHKNYNFIIPSMPKDAITKKAHTMVSSVVVVTYTIQRVKCSDTVVWFKVIDSSSPTITVVICKSTSMLDDIMIQSKLLLYILATYLPLGFSIASSFIWKLHNI